MALFSAAIDASPRQQLAAAQLPRRQRQSKLITPSAVISLHVALTRPPLSEIQLPFPPHQARQCPWHVLIDIPDRIVALHSQSSGKLQSASTARSLNLAQDQSESLHEAACNSGLRDLLSQKVYSNQCGW